MSTDMTESLILTRSFMPPIDRCFLNGYNNRKNRRDFYALPQMRKGIE